MHEMLQETMMTLLHAVILGAVPLLTAIVIAFIKKKTAQITSQIDNETARRSLEELSEAVSAAVAKTSNVYVDNLKASGAFCMEEQAEALKQAKQTALAAITPATQTFLSQTYGNVQQVLEAKIEEAVRVQKYDY